MRIFNQIRMIFALAAVLLGAGVAKADLTTTFIPGDIKLTDWQAVGGSYKAGTLHVEYTDLLSDAMIWVGGADRAQFSLSTETLPAGSGTVDIVLTYKPTKVGTHKGNITIDANPTTMSASYTVTAKAYDPAKLPTLTVDTSTLRTFSANVGENDVQTLSYTVSNALDFGAVRVEPAGNFLLSTASLSKYSGTYKVTVTFRPQEPGAHEATVFFSTPMGQEVQVKLNGTGLGEIKPEEKQGDELTFDGEAYTYVIDDFTTEIPTNKPLKIVNWKNVATEGTRAWWSYADETGNQMAKATAYDSKATDSSPCQMLLLSPQLDYRNTATRLLCFNVMGKMMSEYNNARLDVAIIDASKVDGTDAPVAEVIDGLNIPSTSDENDKWVRYVLDTEYWNLPDRFYVAFIFSGYRGKESTVQYYIDDFSWGREDMPFIRVSHQLMAIETVAGESYTLDPVTVKGFNLTEPIDISVSGTAADNYQTSLAQLPAEGGVFSINFLSEEQGEHNAVVTLKSGDSQSHIMLSANNDVSNGVNASSASQTYSVVDVNGHVLQRSADALQLTRLARGYKGQILILRDSEGRTVKVAF